MKPLSAKLPAQIVAENMAELQSAYTPQEAAVEASRCLFCFDAPCIMACPTGIDIPSFIKKIETENIMGSARTILSANILGASCARVCPTEVLCEGACVMVDRQRDPIKIGRLQRFATDYVYERGLDVLKSPTQKSGKRIAVIGAGPAGVGRPTKRRERSKLESRLRASWPTAARPLSASARWVSRTARPPPQSCARSPASRRNRWSGGAPDSTTRACAARPKWSCARSRFIARRSRRASRYWRRSAVSKSPRWRAYASAEPHRRSRSSSTALSRRQRRRRPAVSAGLRRGSQAPQLRCDGQEVDVAIVPASLVQCAHATGSWRARALRFSNAPGRSHNRGRRAMPSRRPPRKTDGTCGRLTRQC